MDKALHILLLLSLGGTVMALVLMLMHRVLKERLPSAVYYYAWLLVLLRLVTPLPGLIPVEDSGEAAVPAAETRMVAPEWNASRRPWMEDVINEPFVPGGESAVYEEAGAPSPAGTVTAPAQVQREASSLGSSRGWALSGVILTARFWLTLWAMGCVLYAARYIFGYTRFTWALKKTFCPVKEEDLRIYSQISEKRKPRLVRSCGVKTPMLLGALRPVLVLPDWDYSPAMLADILRHELTHYRRGDILYKWFSMAVFSLHWFNPFMGMFRKEIDRACELSCDEHILRDMTVREKRNYGETLLILAADRSLPRSVVATTFATEKRTLKERLEQIMKYKHRSKAGLALALAAILLLGGCGAVLGPEAAEPRPFETARAETLSFQPTPTPAAVGSKEPETVTIEPSSGGETLTVSTVDEFLAAIAPNNTITLEPGEYNLSQAATYGQDLQGGWYTWENSYGDGYQLNIHDLHGLTIIGGEGVTICTDPRGVEVLAFYGCSDIAISGTVVGHTEMPAVCVGGVLKFISCHNVSVSDCGLYGCGTWGITAENCSNVYAENTAIYDCSYGAVQATSCLDIRLENCSIYDCAQDFNSMELLLFKYCYGAALVNCEVYNNCNQVFLESEYSEEVYLLGTRVEGNTFHQALVYAFPYSPVVDGCLFADNGEAPANGVPIWSGYTGVQAVSPEGEELGGSDFAAMTLETCTYEGPAAVETVELEKTLTESGRTEVWVSNIDEFLAAIGPDTIIHMEEGVYDLSEAAHYGSYGSEYYWWAGYGDGPGLVIAGVENLQIIGEGKYSVDFVAVPRYVEVITFRDCSQVILSGITAGHKPINNSTCAGGVVKFERCSIMSIQECGLFGCGTWGVTAENSSDIVVLNTEIYDCSVGAAQIRNSTNVAFDNCDMHDCASDNRILTTGSVNVTVNGKPV